MFSQDAFWGDDIRASQYNNLRSDMAQPGSIIMHAGGSVPIGWLGCYGAVVPVAAYPDLFAVIGYTFGSGGTTFQLPQLIDRFPVGAGSSYSVGNTGGGTKLMGVAELPSHNHTIDPDGEHLHTEAITTNVPSTNPARTFSPGYSAYGNADSAVTSASGAHDHGGVTGTTGTSTAFDIVPAYLGVLFIIKY
jgi:microcystin-dependent protein